MDIDGLLNGVKSVHRIGQDEANIGGRIEELRSGYAALIELTESLRQMNIVRHEAVSALTAT